MTEYPKRELDPFALVMEDGIVRDLTKAAVTSTRQAIFDKLSLIEGPKASVKRTAALTLIVAEIFSDLVYALAPKRDTLPEHYKGCAENAAEVLIDYAQDQYKHDGRMREAVEAVADGRFPVPNSPEEMDKIFAALRQSAQS